MTKYAVIKEPNPYAWSSGCTVSLTDSLIEARSWYDNDKELMKNGHYASVSLVELIVIEEEDCPNAILQDNGSQD